MNNRHYKGKLSAYFNHELSPADRQTVGEHLLNCPECRLDREEIKFGSVLAQKLQRADAPAGVWRNIDAKLDDGTSVRPSVFAFLNLRTAVLASLLLVAAGAIGSFALIGSLITKPAESIVSDVSVPVKDASAPWQVEAIAGSPQIANSADRSNLLVGGVVETDANSRARIDVADIGQVEIDPNSLVRLVSSSETEHRLSLERGALQARISAPPRLFVVDTPTAAAVDLGCAYRLEVDAGGNTKLVVTSGYVSLERDGRESLVPAGASCLTARGKGIGTPFLETATDALKDALFKFDFENGGSSKLEIILTQSRPADTLTLWHLISRVPAADRAKVFERAAALVKLPSGVTRDGVLQLDPEMLERWRGEMELSWYEY